MRLLSGQFSVRARGPLLAVLGRRSSYCCGLGYGPLIAGVHSHPHVSGVLQPTRCQDSLPGGVIDVGADGIGAQPVPIAAQAIVVAQSSASDCERDHVGASSSDLSGS
jgi:hypothetical protein